jgi:hypothetical protein
VPLQPQSVHHPCCPSAETPAQCRHSSRYNRIHILKYMRFRRCCAPGSTVPLQPQSAHHPCCPSAETPAQCRHSSRYNRIIPLSTCASDVAVHQVPQCPTSLKTCSIPVALQQ